MGAVEFLLLLLVVGLVAGYWRLAIIMRKEPPKLEIPEFKYEINLKINEDLKDLSQSVRILADVLERLSRKLTEN